MTSEQIPEDKKDFYLKLRESITEWIDTKAGENNKYSEYLMFAPDFFYLLVKLSLDEQVNSLQKAKFIATIAYFISPVDLLPEFIFGPAGYFDDLILAAYTLNSYINKADPELVRKYWTGDQDVLEITKHIIKSADNILGSGLVHNLRKLF